MTDDASQFCIVKAIGETGGDGNGIAVLVDSAGEGVELLIVNNVNLRHIHSTGHAEVLHDVIDAGILATLQGTGAGGMTYHAGIGEIGDAEPQSYSTDHPRQRL